MTDQTNHQLEAKDQALCAAIRGAAAQLLHVDDFRRQLGFPSGNTVDLTLVEAEHIITLKVHKFKRGW